MWGMVHAWAEARGPAVNRSGVRKVIALRWWKQALPVPRGDVPALRRPAAAYDLGGGEALEVYPDETGTCRAVLVRRKGAAGEVRLLL